MFLEGVRVEVEVGGHQVTNPADQTPLGTVALPRPEDVAVAVSAARRAQLEWGSLAPAARREVLGRCASAVAAAQVEIARTLSQEHGKTVSEADQEVHRLVLTLEHCARLIGDVRSESVLSLPDRALGLILRRPRGVVAAYVGWRFPVAILGRKLGPAVASGNAFIALPEASVSLSSIRVAEVLTEAGLPAGLLAILPTVEGSPSVTPQAGIDLVVHAPEHELAARARSDDPGGPMHTREVPGTDSSIIADDADVESAVSAACWSAFFNAGQSPLAVRRIFVHTSLVDEVMRRCSHKISRLNVGDPATDVQLGTLHDRSVWEDTELYLASLLEGGGRLHIGGGRPEGPGASAGWYFEPTLVAWAGATTDWPAGLAPEGPVLSVVPYTDFDATLQLVASDPAALGTSIWTNNHARIRKAMETVTSPYLWVNSPTRIHDELPLHISAAGSGGADHGPEAFETYERVVSVAIAR